MVDQRFSALDPTTIFTTREAVHAYAQILGRGRFSCLPRRKHGLQLGIVPSVRGLTSGVIQAGIDIELELDLAGNKFLGSVASGGEMSELLAGRSVSELASSVQEFLPDKRHRASISVAAGKLESWRFPDQPVEYRVVGRSATYTDNN